MFSYGKKSYIMGILNVTPDSFSDGGDYYAVDRALNRAKEMVKEGADIVDVGGESTRPGAENITAEEELKRIKPIVEKLVENIEVPISIDTYKPEVAREVLKLGVDIINDVRGLHHDPEMAEVVADYDVPIIIMHNARLKEKQENVIDMVKEFWQESIATAREAGVKKENIILDPGIGFGITTGESIEIMRNLAKLKEMGYPLLLGTSRKSMLGDILEVPPKERVIGTAATTVIGVMQEIDIFRVHDVKENLQAVKVADAIWREK